MLKIFEYVFLEIGGDLSLEIPEKATILKVYAQRNQIKILVIANSENKIEKKYFRIYSTNQAIKKEISKLQYIGTFQREKDKQSKHLFEIKK